MRNPRMTAHLDYVFWGTQEPHFSEEILPYLERLGPSDRLDSLQSPANSDS